MPTPVLIALAFAAGVLVAMAVAAARQSRLAVVNRGRVTTMLSAGDDINTALELRRRIEDGRIKGPRLIVLGRVPTARPAGGGGGGAPRVDPARSDASRAPRTQPANAVPPDETRAAVAAMAQAGVDGLKTNIIVTPGGPETATLAPKIQAYDPDKTWTVTEDALDYDMESGN